MHIRQHEIQTDSCTNAGNVTFDERLWIMVRAFQKEIEVGKEKGKCFLVMAWRSKIVSRDVRSNSKFVEKPIPI